MADKKKKRDMSNMKTVIVSFLLVGLVLFYINHLSNRSDKQRTDKQKSELEQLVTYDMINDYPKTVRDVVKLHNRYFKQFYGQKLSDDELTAMNKNIRQLYCTDLQIINSENSMLINLQASIKNMNEKNYTYTSYELPEASQIKYYTQNGKEMATLEVTITVNSSEGKGYMYVQYVLVKENDLWKIYAWGESQLGNTGKEE